MMRFMATSEVMPNDKAQLSVGPLVTARAVVYA